MKIIFITLVLLIAVAGIYAASVVEDSTFAVLNGKKVYCELPGQAANFSGEEVWICTTEMEE